MIDICWLGQGGFLIATGKCRIVVDPYISDCVFKMQNLARLHPFPVALEDLKPDLVLISHDHLDHLDPEGIPQISALYPDCRYAASPRACTHLAELGMVPAATTRMTVGSKTEFCGVSITAIPAFHSDPDACGYLLEAEGKKIVITGDTVFKEELFLPEIHNADLLLICINGKFGNMNEFEAVKCVEKLRPQTALPMHIGLFAENTVDPCNFVENCHKLGVKSYAMTPGAWFTV